MAFVYNSSGLVNGTSAANPVQFNYTAGTNSKLVVLTLCGYDNGITTRGDTAPTYNGNVMTQVGSNQTSAEGWTEMWYYLTPDAGTPRQISIPNANTYNIRYSCSDYTNASLSASLFNSNGASDGAAADVACSIASVPDGSVCVSCMVHGEKDQFASITGGTTLLGTPSVDEGATQTGAAYSIQSGLGTATHTYVSGGSSDDYNYVMGAWEETASVEPLTGQSNLVISTTGILSVTKPISSQSDVAISTTGDISVITGLSGQSNIAVSTTAKLLAIVYIYDIYDFQNIENDLSGDYVLANDIDATPTNPNSGNWDSGEWPSTTGFRPLSTMGSNEFNGYFDGAGYKITGLYINRPTTNGVSIFGRIATAEQTTQARRVIVENVNFEDVDITGQNYTSAICSIISYAEIEFVGASGSVTGGVTFTTGQNISGIASDMNFSFIRNSFFKGDIIGCYYTGGFCALFDNGSEITDCYSIGTISLGSGTADVSGGGFAGIISGPEVWERCYCSCTITTPGTPSSSYIGGFVGGIEAMPDVSWGDNFWDEEVSGLSSDYGWNSESGHVATGKTTSDMKFVDTYTLLSSGRTDLTNSWDFVGNPNDDIGTNDYWDINGTTNEGYPFLTAFDYTTTEVLSSQSNIAISTSGNLGVVKTISSQSDISISTTGDITTSATKLLSGQSDITLSSTGNLGNIKTVSGQSDIVFSTTATLKVAPTINLQTDYWNVVFPTVEALAGQSDITISTTGVVDVSKKVTSQSDIAISVTGSIENSREVSGQSDIAISVTGSIENSREVSGQSDITVSTTGVLARTVNISGQSDTTLSTTVDMTVIREISSQTDITINTTSNLSAVKGLSSQSNITISTIGNVSKAVTITSQSDIAISTTGDLTTTGVVSLSGQSDISITTTGSIENTKNLASQSDVIISTTGSMRVEGALSGTSVIAISTSGIVTTQGEINLVGQSNIVISTTGYVAAEAALSSQSDISINTVADLSISEFTWHLPIVLDLTKGAISSGSLSDTYSDNGVELVLTEEGGVAPGFLYDFTFGTSEQVPTWDDLYVIINGYYDGNPAHNVKLQQWDFVGEQWDDVTTDTQDFPARANETNYYFNLLSDVKYLSDGQIKLRFNHESAGNILHLFHIDYFYLGTGIILLKGTSNVGITTTGVLSKELGISGASDISISTVGNIEKTVSISGQSDIAISTTGNITTEGEITLAGQSNVALSVTGSVNLTVGLSSQSDILVSATGYISTEMSLAGQSDVTVSVTGELFVGTISPISGQATIAISVTGTLERQRSLVTATGISITTEGICGVVRGLSSLPEIEITATGNIYRVRNLLGTSDIVCDIIGNIGCQYLLQGASLVSINTAAYLGTGVKPAWMVGSNVGAINSVIGRM